MGSARNTGLDYAEGDYVLFVDSDDALAPNCLNTLVDYMAVNELDILYVDEMICDEQLRVLGVNPTFPYMQTIIKREQALEFCMQPSHICSRLYKRELFRDIRFENIWYEDMAAFPELISKSERIGYFKAPVYYYRQHKEAITQDDTNTGNLDVIKAWDKGIGLPLLSEEERNSLAKAVIKSVATFLFFKMKYAGEYIAWYQRVLEGRVSAWQKTCAWREAAVWQEDYPLLQQAKMVQDRQLADRLMILKKLYLEGGVYYFAEHDADKEALGTEHLSLIRKPELELYSIEVKPGSAALYRVNEESRKQNLIARNGERKVFVLEKILVQAFMEFGCPVRIF